MPWITILSHAIVQYLQRFLVFLNHAFTEVLPGRLLADNWAMRVKSGVIIPLHPTGKEDSAASWQCSKIDVHLSLLCPSVLGFTAWIHSSPWPRLIFTVYLLHILTGDAHRRLTCHFISNYQLCSVNCTWDWGDSRHFCWKVVVGDAVGEGEKQFRIFLVSDCGRKLYVIFTLQIKPLYLSWIKRSHLPFYCTYYLCSLFPLLK